MSAQDAGHRLPGEPVPQRHRVERLLLAGVLGDDPDAAMHLKIIRDVDGTPVDCLSIDGHAPAEDSLLLQKAIWDGVADKKELPTGLGEVAPGRRSEPLAIIQLLLLYHLVQEVYRL